MTDPQPKESAMPTEPDVEVVNVDPPVAERWLGCNTHNRPMRRSLVEALARDMTAGRWRYNGEAVKFSSDGVLLDGQHRLAAVALSGSTIPMLVVRNLPAEVQETQDAGAKRTFADVLSLRGESHANALSAACRLVHLWELGVRANLGSAGICTNAELSAVLERNPSLRDAAARAESVRKHCGLPASIIGFTVWLFSQIDEEDADYFFTRLGEATGWADGDPIFELRRVAADSKRVRGERDRTYLAAVTVKTWNAYRRGDKIKQLKWRRGGASPEAFPEPV